MDDLFAGAWEKRDVTPLPVSQPMATDSQGAGLINNIVFDKNILTAKINKDFILICWYKYMYKLVVCSGVLSPRPESKVGNSSMLHYYDGLEI